MPEADSILDVNSPYLKDLIKPPIPPVGVKLDYNVYVPMRDGIKLSVDIYYPEREGRYPALLSVAPYMKGIQQQPPYYAHAVEAGATYYFVPKGYIHVIVQARGSGFSQGEYNLLDIKEQQDGYDLVEWIAQQPWCNGNVGMLGLSYYAMIQYRIAAQRPPHLKCIAPFEGATDLYRDFCYQGGLFDGGFVANWGVDVVLQCVWPGHIDGKLPPANWFADLAYRPGDGPYYWERSVWTKYDKIDVPSLNMVANLSSHHSRGQLDAYSKIKAPKKLLVVPPVGFFGHLRFLLNKPLNEYMLRWFDYWLKGIDTGIMDEPPVAVFDPVTKEWRYENEYPLARTEWRKFYLHSNPAGSADEPPYGLISSTAPGSEKPDKYMVPESTNKLRVGKPVLAFSTPPLDEDLRVWGPLNVVLYGSSTSRDTAWFINMGDVGPDGTPALLTSGFLRASYREVDTAISDPGRPFHPFQNPVLLEPGTVYEFQIELTPVFHTFKAGHRIWIQIASDDLAHYSAPASDIQAMPMPAENAVYHESAYPSHLILPVIPDAPVIKPVGPPVSQIIWPKEYNDFYRTTRRLIM